MAAACRVELLGGLSVRHGERVTTHFRTRKAAELLAYLAHAPGRSHPRDVLAELLWPECDVDSGRHSLSVALTSLRPLLSGDPDEGALVTDRYTVGLRAGAVTTDVAEFEAALRAASAEPDPAARGRSLSEAVAGYGGTFLAGFYEDWIVPEQQRLEELYFQALRQLIGLREAERDWAEALRYALKALALDRLREEAHREVIRLYAAAGNAPAALRQYDELKRLFREEMEAGPAAATESLVREIREGRFPPPAPPEPLASTPARGAPPPSPAPAVPLVVPDLEPIGGAVPIGSRYYVVREADAQFRAAIDRRDSIILLKGARQVGKTSLLARGLQGARESGARVALTHLQIFNSAHLETADTFLRALAESLADQLDLDTLPGETWDAGRGPSPNFRRYVRREVIPKLGAPLVWGLDEIDRLFACPFSSEVFGLFRSWHDERALEPGGPWHSLTVALTYSTEAHLFITDMNQSPFNVGTRLELRDFTLEEVSDLNARYGSPLRGSEELRRFQELLSGQPFLVRQGLHEMASRGTTLTTLEARAADEEWIFGAHLRRILSLLSRETALRDEVAELLRGGALSGPESFYRLRSAGIVDGRSTRGARLRCPLYTRFLSEHLCSLPAP